MKRKLTVASIIAVILMGSSIMASDGVKVLVEGNELAFDQPPVIEEGRTLVPFRAIAEATGATVDWDNDSQTVTCSLGNKIVQLTINSNKMITSEGEITLDVPAKIINSRTMVPLRALSESLGAKVDWDGATSTVNISMAQNVITEETISSDQNNITEKTITKEVKSGQNTVFTISATYPVFEGNGEGLKAVNKAIEEDAQNRLALAESELAPIALDYAVEGESTDWSSHIKYNVKSSQGSVISIYIVNDYYLGGAHPNVELSSLTFNVTTGEKMTADDFVADALNKGKEGIRAMAEAEPDKYLFYDDESFSLSEENWYVEDGEMVFFVEPYEIAPYAVGIVEYRMILQ